MQKYRLIRDDNSEVSEMLVHGVRVEHRKILTKKMKGTIDRQSRIKDLELAKSKIEIAIEMLIGCSDRVISKENKESLVFLWLNPLFFLMLGVSPMVQKQSLITKLFTKIRMNID